MHFSVYDGLPATGIGSVAVGRPASRQMNASPQRATPASGMPASLSACTPVRATGCPSPPRLAGAQRTRVGAGWPALPSRAWKSTTTVTPVVASAPLQAPSYAACAVVGERPTSAPAAISDSARKGSSSSSTSASQREEGAPGRST